MMEGIEEAKRAKQAKEPVRDLPVRVPELPVRARELPVLTLAYIGDAVFELWVRMYLIGKGLARADDLHHAAVSLVRAKGQAALVRALLPELEEEEAAVFQRGRNAKGPYPRHCDVVAYRYATGFEALIGYLHMSGRQERLDHLLRRIDALVEGLEEFCEEDG